MWLTQQELIEKVADHPRLRDLTVEWEEYVNPPGMNFNHPCGTASPGFDVPKVKKSMSLMGLLNNGTFVPGDVLFGGNEMKAHNKLIFRAMQILMEEASEVSEAGEEEILP